MSIRVGLAWTIGLFALSGTAAADCRYGWVGPREVPGTAGYNSQIVDITLWDHDRNPETSEVAVAAGYFTSAGRSVVRHIAIFDGETWRALSGSDFSNGIQDVAVFNGDLIAAGYFTSIGGQPTNRIARRVGNAWEPLGDGFNQTVNCLEVIDGELYAGGDFTLSGARSVRHVARWDGAEWQQVGIAGGRCRDLAQHGGEVYCALNSGDTVQTVKVFRSGDWVAPATNRLNGTVHSLATFQGRLVAGGSFSVWPITSTTPRNLAVLDGDEWSQLVPFNNFWSTFEYVQRVAVVHDKLLILGHFRDISFVESTNAVTWDGVTVSAIGTGVGTFAQSANDFAGAAAVWGDGILVGGQFKQAGSADASNVALWSDNAWRSAGTRRSTDGAVYDSLSDGDDLIIVGRFDRVDGVASVNAAHFDGTNWRNMDFGLPTYGLAITRYDDDLLIAGEGRPLSRWDGTGWWNFQSGSSGLANAVCEYQSNLYVGGELTFTAGGPIVKLAMWDGAGWSEVTPPPDAPVRALKVVGDELLVGGGFRNIGTEHFGGIAAWNGASWRGFGAGVAGTNAPRVVAIESFGGLVHIGGQFTQASGVEALNIARWNGATWEPLGGGVSSTFGGSEVRTFANFNGELFVGGLFDRADGVATGAVARWDGSAWHSIEQEITGDVRSIRAEGSRLRVHGADLSVGTNLISNFAELAPRCVGDLDGDLQVGLVDLATLLTNLGIPAASCADGDSDGDQLVGLEDLARLLARFGTDCGDGND